MRNDVTREMVIAEAREWLGTPFHHQASVKGAGCDCIGLVKGVGVALGIVDYDPNSALAKSFSNYPKLPDSKRMREGLATWLINIPFSEASVGDILFMSWGRDPMHVAIKTDCGIIHSYSGIKKVIEHALDEEWNRRIVAAYRYPALRVTDNG